MAGTSTNGLSQAAYAKAKEAWKPWEYKGPKLLLSGEPAAHAVSRILPSAGPLVVPSSFGTVVLVPGTIWSGNKMLVQVQTMTVVWAVDDKIYEWGTQDFVRCEWMDAGAEGARRAEGMRRLAKIEMELLAGIFAPFYLVLGVTIAKSAVFYHSNKRVIELVRTHLSQVLADGKEIEKKFPTLYKKLRNTALKELLLNFPQGITAEDVAFFVGRVIRGVSGAVDTLELGQRLTLAAIMKIVGVFATLVTITHSPSILLHSGEHALKALAKEINAKGADMALTEAELKQIATELSQTPNAEQILKSFGASLDALVPALTELSEAYKKLD